jgi:hypothetical protein
MKKTFLMNDFLRSMEFLSKSPSVRGVWLAAQAYCSERETGGVIAGAKSFKSSVFRTLIGAGGNRRAIDDMVEAGLARWEGTDLHLAGYDLDGEAKYRSQRDAGRRGGIASGEARRGQHRQREVPQLSDQSGREVSEGEEAQGFRAASRSEGPNYPSTSEGEERQIEGEERQIEDRLGTEGECEWEPESGPSTGDAW